MRTPFLNLISGFVVGVIGITSAQLAANAQLTVQRPSNVIRTGSNAWNYLVVEGESYASSQDGDDTTGFGKVYNDAALADAYGYPLLPTNSTASMQGALGTIGAGFSRFSDKVTYQMVFSDPGDYYLYIRFTMFENSANGGNNTYLNEDSFYLPPDFNKDPQFDWDPPGTAGSDDGGYTEGCCGGAGYLYILDYQGDGSRTDHSTDTNYWEGNFHWNQLFASQFLNPTTFTNADGSPRAGNPFHYVVTPDMVGVPQDFTIATREPGITIDLFLFSTRTNLLNGYTQQQLDDLLVKKVAVQGSGNVVPTSSNSWSYLVLEAENFMAKSNRDLTIGFAAVAPGSTNIDSYGTTILATNTTASGKAALYTQSPSFGRFSDKINYQVQFSTPGDYYLYMRFTMFENSANGGNGTYLNEDSFILPPDFNKDSQFDWDPPGTTGADDGGYTEGCCGGAGFLYILDYQGNGSRSDHSTDTNYWEGNFHWNQLFASQFLNTTTFTNADGSPRAGNVFHYVVTPAMVGVPQNFQIAIRESGVAPDLFLFSTHTNLLNDYTQEQLDALMVYPLSVQRPTDSVTTPSNTWYYLKMEGENYATKTAADNIGFTRAFAGDSRTDAYGNQILASDTTASGKAALYTQSPSFGRFSDKINYYVQFASTGDYYLYMRFTMFENSANGGNGTYLNEDSLIFPPDFNKDSQFDWDPPGTAGADNGGYAEGCCGGAGWLFILDYQGNGSRTDRSTDTNYWEGNFHWNQLFASQFLNTTTFTNADGTPRAGNPFHYVVTPALVGVPQSFQISFREPGVAPDLFLFSTHTNLLNDYTQEQLDALLLGGAPLAITSVSSSGGNVTINWAGATGVLLQKTTTLPNSASWTDIPSTLGNNSYSEPLTATPTFFRLKK